MAASARSRQTSSLGGHGYSNSGSNSNSAGISIRTPRAGAFNPSRRPLLLRLSPRVIVLALAAALCALYTLLPSTKGADRLHDENTSTNKMGYARMDAESELPEAGHRNAPLLEPLHQLRNSWDSKKKQPDVELPSNREQQDDSGLPQRAYPPQNVRHKEFVQEGTDATASEPALLAHFPSAEDTAAAKALQVEKKTGPFDTYLCAGDEWQGADDDLYTKPFRFHVYKNMPDHLAKDVIARAAHWWQPDNASNQFITEVQIYKYLSMHPCHTDDPLEADAFVVPAQTVSGIWLSREKGPNGEAPLKDEGAAYMKEVMTWIKSQRTGRRFDMRDHYVVSVPWWMGGRPYGGHVNLIGVEVPISFGTHQSFSDTLYLRASNDIIVPYPDPDSYAFYTDEMLDNAVKDLHMVFVGQNRVVAPIRQKVWDQLKAYNKRRGERPQALWHHLKNRDAIGDVKKKTARAIFGPVMKGDSYSSRRLFSLLFAGTIPVIICDFCMLPYQDMIDYSKFAIFLPESEILDNPDYDLFDALDAIPQSELDRLRKNGRAVRKHFIFHEGAPQPGDAFDMMVREMAFTHLRNRGLKAMMLRAYGEDDEDKLPLEEQIPVPGQELPFVGPGVPEEALKIRIQREAAQQQPLQMRSAEDEAGGAAQPAAPIVVEAQEEKPKEEPRLPIAAKVGRKGIQ